MNHESIDQKDLFGMGEEGADGRAKEGFGFFHFEEVKRSRGEAEVAMMRWRACEQLRN